MKPRVTPQEPVFYALVGLAQDTRTPQQRFRRPGICDSFGDTPNYRPTHQELAASAESQFHGGHLYGRPRTVVTDTIAVAHNGQPVRRSTVLPADADADADDGRGGAAVAEGAAAVAGPQPWTVPTEPVAEVALLAQCYLMPAPLHPSDVRRPPLAPGGVLLEHLLQYEPYLPDGWLAKHGLKHVGRCTLTKIVRFDGFTPKFN